ncbi:hypothetical protein A0H81_14194 [Grifola frondosa]|uniref:Ricin B lectin domain-containing protein n=1 Tax=Grifola frondosa TaxID=5627 RepID=A0A1C7LPM0_GRIFR|nr:hypothetical protein A0H81_14194 [Grifola frondosa]
MFSCHESQGLEYVLGVRKECELPLAFMDRRTYILEPDLEGVLGPHKDSEGAYWIRNKSNGSILGIGSKTADDLVPLMWLIEALSDGVRFRIRNAQSANVLDVKENNTADGASVIIYTPNGNNNQNWNVEWVDDAGGMAYYRITSISTKKTGWYLQYDKTQGVIVGNKISSTSATRSQLWFLDAEEGSEAYVIRSVEDDTKVLDLSGSGMADGTPVIAYTYHAGPNQQWEITDVDYNDPEEDRVRIVSNVAHTVVQVIEGASYGTLQAQTNKGDTTQTWRLHQYPFPSLFWSTIQNLKTGTFLKQDSSTVSPSSGARNALDYSVQWRFISNPTQPHHYSLVNRGTGWVVVGRKTSPTVTAANSSQGENGGLWARERAGQGMATVNTETVGAIDHYAGGSTIEAYPNNGTDNPYHQWISVRVIGSRAIFCSR